MSSVNLDMVGGAAITIDMTGGDVVSIEATGALPGIPAGGTTGQVLAKSSATDYDVTWSTSAGGGAPTDASYVTLATNTTLSAERVLTEGTGIDITDAGAGSTVTVAVDLSELSAGGDLSGTYNAPQIGTGVIVNDDVNASAAIALSKLASISTARLLGRTTAGSGAIEELAQAAVFAFLGTGTPSATTFLRGDGSWSTPTASGGFDLAAQIAYGG